MILILIFYAAIGFGFMVGRNTGDFVTGIYAFGFMSGLLLALAWFVEELVKTIKDTNSNKTSV